MKKNNDHKQKDASEHQEGRFHQIPDNSSDEFTAKDLFPDHIPLPRATGMIREGQNGEDMSFFCYYSLPDGSERIFEGRSVRELRLNISNALDEFYAGRPALMPEHNSLAKTFAINLEELPSPQRDYALELKNVAVFGNESERETARKEIFRLMGAWNIYNDQENIEKRKKELRTPKEPAPEFPLTSDTVQKYMNKHIDSGEKLANTVRCSKSTISRIRNGKTKTYDRNLMLRIGVSLELPKIDLRQLMLAVTPVFPETTTDFWVEKRVDKGITDYCEICDILYRIEELTDDGITDYDEIRRILKEEFGVEDY